MNGKIEADLKAKTLRVKNLKTGEEFDETFDKLVVTTGSWPIIPPLEGLDLENVQLCKNYNQAKEIFAKKTDK